MTIMTMTMTMTIVIVGGKGVVWVALDRPVCSDRSSRYGDMTMLRLL